MYGERSRQLSIAKASVKQQTYSISFVAAMTQDRIISSQIIEGNVDSILFENFLYHTLRSIRTDKNLHSKRVVLFMDNAAIHKYSEVLETAKKFRVDVLFNAQYSPWLNPIEQLFGQMKKRIRADDTRSK